MIIGLTGPKLSGKGTASNYLQEHHGAKAFSMSGILTDIVNRLYLPNSRANLIGIVTDLRARFGEDILARVLQRDIEEYQKKYPEQLIVIDGIRMPSEVELFSQLPDFTLVYIDAPIEQRYNRATKRGEKEGETEMTFEEFQAEEKAATESHMEMLQQSAHTVVVNGATIEDLYASLEGVIEQKKK